MEWWWLSTVQTTKPGSNLDELQNWILAGSPGCRNHQGCNNLQVTSIADRQIHNIVDERNAEAVVTARLRAGRYVMLPNCPSVPWFTGLCSEQCNNTRTCTILSRRHFFFFKRFPSSSVNRITCWVNTLHECPGTVKGKRSDLKFTQRAKYSSVSLFLFPAFHSRDVQNREQGTRNKRVGGRQMLEHECQTCWMKPIATQVRWEHFCSVRPRGQQWLLLCNSDLCNTSTTYTHSLQYLSWRRLDNAITIKGRYRQTRHPLAVLSHFLSNGVTCLPLAKPHTATFEASCTQRAQSSTWMVIVFWSPRLLTRPLVAPLKFKKKNSVWGKIRNSLTTSKAQFKPLPINYTFLR